jgi:hypothetical protein
MDPYWLAGSIKNLFPESLLVGWVNKKDRFHESLLVGWVKETIVFMNPYWLAGPISRSFS